MRTINKILSLFVLAFVFNSCNENAIPIVTEPISENASFGKFFFYMPDAPDANFYFGDTKISSTSSSVDGEVKGRKYKSIFPSNAYALVPTGNSNVNVRDLDGNALVTKDLNFEANKHYSIFLLGDTTADLFQLEDALPPVDIDNIYWRFVNTLTNIPFPVDAYAVRAEVAATDDTPYEPVEVIPLGTNINYKEAGEYIALKTGKYKIRVFENGTTYDPETSDSFIEHRVTLVSENRVYSTQIRGVYPDSNGIDYWRER